MQEHVFLLIKSFLLICLILAELFYNHLFVFLFHLHFNLCLSQSHLQCNSEKYVCYYSARLPEPPEAPVSDCSFLVLIECLNLAQWQVRVKLKLIIWLYSSMAASINNFLGRNTVITDLQLEFSWRFTYDHYTTILFQ